MYATSSGSTARWQASSVGVGDAGAQVPEVVEADRQRAAPARCAAAPTDHDAAELAAGARRAGPPDLGEHGQIVLAQEAIDGDEGRGVAVAQHVAELAGARPRADGHQRRAEQRHGEVDQQPLGAVVHEERDLVAAPDAEPVQPLREPAHARRAPRRRSAASPPPTMNSRPGCARRHLVEQVGQRAAARRVHGSPHALGSARRARGLARKVSHEPSSATRFVSRTSRIVATVKLAVRVRRIIADMKLDAAAWPPRAPRRRQARPRESASARERTRRLIDWLHRRWIARRAPLSGGYYCARSVRYTPPRGTTDAMRAVICRAWGEVDSLRVEESRRPRRPPTRC